jgi:hypothetical protein
MTFREKLLFPFSYKRVDSMPKRLFHGSLYHTRPRPIFRYSFQGGGRKAMPENKRL